MDENYLKKEERGEREGGLKVFDEEVMWRLVQCLKV